MNLDTCPIFDESDVDGSMEAIQAWSGFEVIYDTAPITIGRGKNKKDLSNYWTMYWEQGFMNTGYAESDERYARMYAALFIFLWCHKVGVSMADMLAYSFVKCRKSFEEKYNVGKHCDVGS